MKGLIFDIGTESCENQIFLVFRRWTQRLSQLRIDQTATGECLLNSTKMVEWCQCHHAALDEQYYGHTEVRDSGIGIREVKNIHKIFESFTTRLIPRPNKNVRRCRAGLSIAEPRDWQAEPDGATCLEVDSKIWFRAPRSLLDLKLLQDAYRSRGKNINGQQWHAMSYANRCWAGRRASGWTESLAVAVAGKME